MTIQNPVQLVAQNVCGDEGNCGPYSVEASLSCSPIGWSADQNNGWLFDYGIISVTFWTYCPSDATYSLSKWIPATVTWRFCPVPNAQNQEPNPYYWISNWAYFGGVSAGTCTNQYRIKATLVPTSPTTVNVSCVVQALNQVNGENVWQGYSSWAQDMSEIPGRLKQYDSRGYQTSTQYIPISVSQVGGKGDVTHISMVAGVVPFLKYCGSACKMFDGTSFQGCANAVVISKDDYNNVNYFPPYAFLMGRSGNPCGTNLTSYCLCDQITLTSTSPVQGETINNEWQGPNSNDFVQVFGYSGAAGQVVGAIQQLQVGIAPDEYLVMLNINEGPLQFGTYKVSTSTWIWGSAQKVREGNPTVYFIDRPDRYYYLYSFRFPNQDILPYCSGTTTTTYPPIPTTTTMYPFPPTTTTSTTTTCAPSMMTNYSYVDVPDDLAEMLKINQASAQEVVKPPEKLTIEEKMAILKRGQSGCGCGNKLKPR